MPKTKTMTELQDIITPEHKGGVENDVKYIKNNFLPYFLEKQKQKGRKIPIAQDAMMEIVNWSTDVADTHIVSTTGKSPLEMFIMEEKQTLKTLPLERWDKTQWKICTVNDESRIHVEKSTYTVPCLHIGTEVQVCFSSKTVNVFKGFVEIAVHEKAKKPYSDVVKIEHLPPNYEEYLKSTKIGILHWVESYGSTVRDVVNAILNNGVTDGIHPARGVLGLAKKYTISRLENACRRVLLYNIPNYQSVKNILQKNLDSLPVEIPATTTGQTEFKFAHGQKELKMILSNNIFQEESNG